MKLIPKYVLGIIITTILSLSPSSASGKELSKKVIFKRSAPAVPLIITSRSIGSGALITSNGHIVTNHHVIRGYSRVGILLPGRKKATSRNLRKYLKDNRHRVQFAVVLKSWPASDIALLKLQGSRTNYPTIAFGDSTTIEVGEEVVAIGHPQGLVWTMTRGIISSVREKAIQTDAAINPGNSGGPLLNLNGRIVGINTFIRKNANNLGFAVPSNHVKKLLSPHVSLPSQANYGGSTYSPSGGSSSSGTNPSTPDTLDPDIKQAKRHVRLGRRCLRQKRYSQAFYHFKMAAEKEYPRGYAHLAECYYRGWGAPSNKFKAYELYKKAAHKQDPVGQKGLGDLFYRGDGAVKDFQKAAHWYGMAAKTGYPPAQMRLGFMYQKGQGVFQDYKQARKWYEKAASRGQADALTYLGIMYLEGKGVEKDIKKAFRYFREGASQGSARAQKQIGFMYQYGKGVKKNLKKAFYCYRSAAQQGLASAQVNLAYLYENGLGVDKNLEKAESWYSKAAAQGDGFAQQSLKRVQRELGR